LTVGTHVQYNIIYMYESVYEERKKERKKKKLNNTKLQYQTHAAYLYHCSVPSTVHQCFVSYKTEVQLSGTFKRMKLLYFYKISLFLMRNI